ncbi:MAG: lysophospholipid acyltransferase family protein [Candidatus Omnitrophica bacterium]|nr:lysophospholipid acyltransferase family protein [Candidatus Omnitrophota bacterium]
MKIKKFKTRTVELAQYFLFRLVCVFVDLLPFRLACSLGKWIGCLLYLALGRSREVALENLNQVYGNEKTDSEIKKIAIQSFENLGMFAVEFIRIPKILNQLDRYVVIRNEESVLEMLQQKRGVVLIVSHFGNWEWMGVTAGARAQEKGIKINAVARTLGNPFLYRYVVEKLRGATGLQTMNKKGAARETMKRLEQNEIVCILIDQHERNASVPVPYFGRPAWTTSLPAVLAIQQGVPIIPVFSFRQKNGPMIVDLGEPFPVIDTGDYDRDVIENTKQYMQAIEQVVRKRPGDWLWMHARWRASRTEKVR